MHLCSNENVKVYEVEGSTRSAALAAAASGLAAIEDDITEVAFVRLWENQETGMWACILYVS